MKITPLLVLEKTESIPGFMDAPNPQQRYDSRSQLWLWADSGQPVVLEDRMEASKYGETITTLTSEGADQSEGSRRIASQWGETSETRTSEGVDQSEGSRSLYSSYGETIMTKTSEGLDQSEVSRSATDPH